jgi:hypothetical protein
MVSFSKHGRPEIVIGASTKIFIVRIKHNRGMAWAQ